MLPRAVKKLLGRNLMLALGLVIVLAMSLAALLAPWIAPFDPNALHLDNILEPPSSRFLLGTVLGLVSGYFRRWVDECIMRVVDIMLCFPSFFLILAVIAFLEPNLTNIMVVIGLTSWMGVTRLVRAEALTLREREFVDAARLAGTSTAGILFRHILPNALAPVLITATLGVAGAILVESSLSFLGLGVQPPAASWGNMLMDGKSVIETAPWLSVYPGLAILVTVLGYNLLGESLRDIFDPRLRQ